MCSAFQATALAQDHESVDGDALGKRFVARGVDVATGIVGTVARHVDGAPGASNGACASCAVAKSMPPLIEVRSANERGASSS